MSTSRFLAGALLGLAAGLLIAPEKGEDMRDDIMDTAGKWKRKMSKFAGKTSSELDDLKHLLGKEVDGLSDDVRHRILTILEESKSTAKNIKGSFSNGIA